MSRNGTEYETKGRWYDVNLVRWYEDVMRPVGGWQKPVDTVISGTTRGILTWRDNDNNRWCAVGSDQGLYVWNGGTVHDVTPGAYVTGRTDAIFSYGYGAGTYGSGTYGTARTSGTAIDATTWSFDTWGENLVGVASHEEVIWEWTGDVSTAAAAVANAPTAMAVLVTPERIMVALGAGGDPRKVQWSDQEDNTDWTPTTTNYAGDLLLTTEGLIRTALRVTGETLILTSSDAHAMEFIGQPFVHGIRKAGSSCGVIGANAASAFDGRAMWMGERSFFMYQGNVTPVRCEVADYVFNDINRTQASKIHTRHSSQFGEIWWFYCSADSDEIDRYVIYNYREGHWSIGLMDRTCFGDEGVFRYPLAVDSSGYLYEHENGWDDDGSSRTVYAQSGPMELGNGDRVMAVTQVLPDADMPAEMTLTMKGRYTPEGTETTHGPYTLTPYTDVRLQARQLAFRIDQAEDDDWRIGRFRLDATAGSRR
ncbi:MAG: hypothetical protein ACPHCN_07225 [Mycobacterium sp.]